MKRALLIATGTVGGLGAVLAVTPPQFTSTQSSSMALPGAGAATAAPSASAATASSTPSATATSKKSATKSATKSAKVTKSVAPVTAQTQTPSATPTQTQTTQPAATKSVSGTFTGDTVDVRYGNVQVKITVENGKITDAQAVQAPNGRNDRWTQMAVPILRQQTLQAQSAQIHGASGASFTSYGWYTSLVSALAKAGM
jgi:uncharacterized protein with FMN-binding domain